MRRQIAAGDRNGRVLRKARFGRVERIGARQHPDMILRIDRQAGRLAQDHVIGQARPRCIGFEQGHGHAVVHPFADDIDQRVGHGRRRGNQRSGKARGGGKQRQ